MRGLGCVVRFIANLAAAMDVVFLWAFSPSFQAES